MVENELVGELLQKMADKFYKGNYLDCFGEIIDYARFHESLTDKLVPDMPGREKMVGRNVKVGKKWVWCVVEPDKFKQVFPDMLSLLADFYAYKEVDVRLPYVKYHVLPASHARQIIRMISNEERLKEDLEKKLERYSKLEELPMPKKIAYDYLFRKTLRQIAINYISNSEEDKLKDLLDKYNVKNNIKTD